MIHSIMIDYYIECSGKDVITGSIVSHQTYGDMLRFNPHWHCQILEGGIDCKNDFYHVNILMVRLLQPGCLSMENLNGL
jgi:hypothetical protein